MQRRHFNALTAASLGLGFCRPSNALDSPKQPTVLRVGGKIGNKNAGEFADLDMPMLSALPQHSFTTNTPSWYAKAHQFTGPLLREVLKAVDAQGSKLRAEALDAYKVDIPASDAQEFDVIIARLLDGQPMPVRNKGPLFIIYPFDSSSQLRSQRYYSRSIWQLKSITVL